MLSGFIIGSVCQETEFVATLNNHRPLAVQYVIQSDTDDYQFQWLLYFKIFGWIIVLPIFVSATCCFSSTTTTTLLSDCEATCSTSEFVQY